MPTILTHALIPLAGGLALAPRPVRWRLLICCAAAGVAPDLDVVSQRLLAITPGTIFAHRGASHSLFTAALFGLVAAMMHRWLRVSAPVAALAIGLSMASHGLLDTLTDNGQGVALLWPLNEWRIISDWRPIHASPIRFSRFFTTNWARILDSEGRYLWLPALIVALVVRGLVRPGQRRA